MPGLLLHVGAQLLCPHGGQISTVSSNLRVLVSGQAVATMADLSLVAGCAFNVSGAPQPCIKVQWLGPAARVMVGGQPALLQTSPGLCESPAQVPQGPPVLVAGQLRVQGT
jgi:hypothetical protein